MSGGPAARRAAGPRRDRGGRRVADRRAVLRHAGRGARRQRHAARRRGRLRHRPEDGAGRRPADLLAEHGPVSERDRRAPSPRASAPAARRPGGRADRRGRPGPRRRARRPGGSTSALGDGLLTVVHELDLPGDRAAVRAGAVEAALMRLLDRLPSTRSAGTPRADQVLRHQRTCPRRDGDQGHAPRTVSTRRPAAVATGAAARGRTGDGHDAAAHPAGEHPAGSPAAAAADAARRLGRSPGEPRLPLGGRARAEGGVLRAARLDLRRPGRRARRPAGRGQPGDAAGRAQPAAPCARSPSPACGAGVRPGAPDDDPAAAAVDEAADQGAAAAETPVAEPALALVGGGQPARRPPRDRRRLACAA